MKTKIILILLLVGLVATFFFFKNNNSSQEELSNQIKNKVQNRSFSGIVKKKFIDSSFHNRETITISNKEAVLVTDFIYEDSSLFNFINVGDSIFKKKNDLNVRVIRDGVDSLIPLTFKRLAIDGNAPK